MFFKGRDKYLGNRKNLRPTAFFRFVHKEELIAIKNGFANATTIDD